MSELKIDEVVFDKLVKILKKHGLSELEYQDGETRIKISTATSQVQNIASIEQVSKISSKSLELATENGQDLALHEGALKSPMVGTSYMAPEPGASDFVALGQIVQKGDPVLIIEAMKVMNLIKAHKSGKIIHIAVTNCSPIEYGQLLVVIENQ